MQNRLLGCCQTGYYILLISSNFQYDFNKFIYPANEETVRLIKMSKGEAYAYHVDLTKREDIYRTAERVKKEIGKVFFKQCCLQIRVDKISVDS